MSISNYSFNNNFSLHNKKSIKLTSKTQRNYDERKKQFDNHLRKVRKIHSKIYIEQIKKLEMEENKLKEDYENNKWTEDKKIKLTELKEERLLLEIKKKNAFLDSIGIVGKSVSDKDDDVDEDNFQGLKNYHMDLSMGSNYINNLKFKIEPRYILKQFKKKTLEKFKGNKGIFFGSYDRNKYKYKLI